MEIEVVQAYVVTESTRTRLTKAVAKQFPVRYSFPECCRALKDQDPICKVTGETLGRPNVHWLVLVPHETAGYVWVVWPFDDHKLPPTVIL